MLWIVLSAIDGSQVIQAILIGLPATALGLLAYRRSRKVDAVAEQSGIVTESRAGTQQVIEGLNHIIDNLQEDNKSFRQDIRYLTERLDQRDRDHDVCRKQLVLLQRRYGDNGDPS